MILDPTPVTLFCGIGSHASSVFLYLKKYALKKVYIIYSKYNTEIYQVKISTIKEQIKTRLESLDHIVKVNYLQINKSNFLQSYYSIARLYQQERDNYIISDLTAGHKIISYVIFYAHSYMRYKFLKESKLIYMWDDDDTPLELPSINISILKKSLNNLLQDIDYFNNHDLMRKILGNELVDDKYIKLSLPLYLQEGNKTITKSKYASATISRNKSKLRMNGYLDNQNNLTLKGKMYLFLLKISS